MILSSTVTTIKTVFEPAQLAKVEITSNGFNLAINQVNYNTTPTVCKEFFNNTQIFYESCALPVHNS